MSAKREPVIAYIGHYSCPAHNFHSLCVDDMAGTGGTRVLGGKCCGSWKLVHRWPVRVKDIEELHNCLLGEQEAVERKSK